MSEPHTDWTKSREVRLRRAAERQGLTLRRSRRRDPRAIGYGRYWLYDRDTDHVVFGGLHGVTLDAVEGYLYRPVEGV